MNYHHQSEGKPPKTLSCSSCRQRKIKCDKVQSICTQCSRFGLECIYPSRKPNRRAPRPRQRELLDRISRLENIVGQADPQKLQQLDEGTLEAPESSPSSGTGGGDQPPPSKHRSHKTAAPPAATAKYLSSDFWGNLSAEVEGIRHALDQPSDDSDEEQYEASPESFDASTLPTGPSGFMFGNPQYNERSRISHPPVQMRSRLWSLYVRNVDPVMKVLHRPTVHREFQALANADQNYVPSAPVNALLFAVYFCAVTSLTAERCQAQLGDSYDVLTAKYRLLAERALAAANYLNTTDLITLQAFAIFVSLLRRHSHDRSCWSLTALLIRLAQAINLHKDGDGSQFSPYEGEMRRRLWHFCVILDIRGSEDRGSDPLLTASSHNTQVPTSADDDSFGPNSNQPLVTKVGPAENVITLTQGMSCAIFEHLGNPETFNPPIGQHSLHTEQGVVAAVRRLESTFIHSAESNHPQSRYAAYVARIVILRLWLVIQYPLASQPVATRPRVNRDTMLKAAIAALELAEKLMSPPWEERWGWLTETFVQWHPLAVALAELCVQTEGEVVDNAWNCVERVFSTWKEKIADTAKGSLWKPIRKLLKKAKAARANAMMKNMKLGEPSQSQWHHMQTPQPLQFTPQLMHPQQQQQMMTPIPQPNLMMVTPPYDSMNMDPSYLFEYPAELRNVDFEPKLQMDGTPNFSPWNEFVHDTMMDDGVDSGGDSV